MEASKFADLWKARSYFRYWKKFLVFGIAYGIIWTGVNALLTAVLGMLGVTVDSLMGAVQVGGIGVVITVLVGLVLQMVVGGFLLEYVSNTNNKAIRWVKK